ncbi:Cytochrome P450 [Rhypophila decipiens]
MPAEMTPLLLLVIGGYRVVLHPLNTYPGPLVAKLTLWYPTWFAIQKRLHIVIFKNHQKYGSVVRIGPGRLVFNTITALRVQGVPRCHGRRATNLFTALDPHVHRQKRKLVGQVITDRAMRSFEPTMSSQIDVFLKLILSKAKTSSPVNMTDMSRHLGLDIVGHLAFGSDLHMQTSEENRFIINGMQFGNYRGSLYMHYPILPKLYIGSVLDWVFYEKRERFFRLLERLIKARAALGQYGRSGDFYSYVASEMGVDEKSNPRGGELWAEAWFFLTAGGDTVVAGISACFFYLSRNPECYKRLAHEVRSTFSSAKDIKSGPLLASCVYLRACFDEALRMSPPTSTTLWRVQDDTSSEPLIIDGHVVPPGTTFGVNPYALHHNEDYFPSPFTFRPERWLDEPQNQEARKVALEAFAAFSVGSRSCAGKAMAYLEASLVLAKVLWFFDFEAAPGDLGKIGGGGPELAKQGRGHEDEYQIYDIFTSQHNVPYLVFHTRHEFWKELA